MDSNGKVTLCQNVFSVEGKLFFVYHIFFPGEAQKKILDNLYNINWRVDSFGHSDQCVLSKDTCNLMTAKETFRLLIIYQVYFGSIQKLSSDYNSFIIFYFLIFQSIFCVYIFALFWIDFDEETR